MGCFNDASDSCVDQQREDHEEHPAEGLPEEPEEGQHEVSLEVLSSLEVRLEALSNLEVLSSLEAKLK